MRVGTRARYFLGPILVIAALCLGSQQNCPATTSLITSDKIMLLSLSSPHGPVEFLVEAVSTPKTRAQGLMYREHLPDKHGMLFIFENTRAQVLWMKNTLIPLDLIFFDDDFKIIGLIQNTKPKSLASLDIDQPSRYVLELISGSVKKYDLQIGARAQLKKTQVKP